MGRRLDFLLRGSGTEFTKKLEPPTKGRRGRVIIYEEKAAWMVLPRRFLEVAPAG